MKIRILLAEDDMDDIALFKKELKEIAIPNELKVIEDGEKLMVHLTQNSVILPDVLFLDVNMPRQNGSECLTEIKRNSKIMSLPVVLYSTSYDEEETNKFFNEGAHYFIRKTDSKSLRKAIKNILEMISEGKFTRPARDKFILSL